MLWLNETPAIVLQRLRERRGKSNKRIKVLQILFSLCIVMDEVCVPSFSLLSLPVLSILITSLLRIRHFTGEFYLRKPLINFEIKVKTSPIPHHFVSR